MLVALAHQWHTQAHLSLKKASVNLFRLRALHRSTSIKGFQLGLYSQFTVPQMQTCRHQWLLLCGREKTVANGAAAAATEASAANAEREHSRVHLVLIAKSIQHNGEGP